MPVAEKKMQYAPKAPSFSTERRFFCVADEGRLPQRSFINIVYRIFHGFLLSSFLGLALAILSSTALWAQELSIEEAAGTPALTSLVAEDGQVSKDVRVTHSEEVSSQESDGSEVEKAESRRIRLEKQVASRINIQSDDVAVLVLRTSEAIESRLQSEGSQDDIRLEVSAGAGVDARKLKRVFAPRLEAQLRKRGKVRPNPRARLRAQALVSTNGTRLFVVVTLEGGRLLGPSTVVVSAAQSMTLERSLGGNPGRGQTHFVMRRVGLLPAGVLDVFLIDLQGDFVDELAVLSLSGLTLYELLPSTYEWEKLEHADFPRTKGAEHLRWPRLLAGWLGKDGQGRIHGATTAGHSFVFDFRTHRMLSSRRSLVPLAQPFFRGVSKKASKSSFKGSILWAMMDKGNPSVRMRRPTSLKGKVAALSKRIRDVQSWRGPQKLRWAWVDDNGFFNVQYLGSATTRPLKGTVGDRFLLADLNGDGEVEALVTSSGGPGESDSLSVISLTGVELPSPIFRQGFPAGSITALAQGDVDLDERVDVLLVEEGQGKNAVLWHLEYAP
ncbi:MAG: hypothetical protein GY822_21875 [Deltaproteobacteria bacterium]|nr:hypothetical protein [Deltaproteobacteria bacterium]